MSLQGPTRSCLPWTCSTLQRRVLFNTVITPDTNNSPADTDRLPRPIVLGGPGIPALLVLLAATPLGAGFFYLMIIIPALLLVWAALALWSLVRCLAFVTSRRWKLSALAAVLPVVVCLVGLNFWSFVRGCNYLGDVLHFVVARPYYEHVIANLPRDGRPRLAVFNWGGSIWVSHGLVYDESDEVALAPGRQSAQWLADPRLAELECGGFGVQPLWSHYYLASFPC